MSEVKQVIVIRKDLKMRRGKEIAQGSHASISFLTKRLIPQIKRDEFVNLRDGFTNVELKWMSERFTKVCLQVNSEAELHDIYAQAKVANLEVNIILDAGLTEFDGVATYTCLAIGPDYSEKIDKVTGHLKLY